MIESFNDIDEIRDHLEDSIGKKLTSYIVGFDKKGNDYKTKLACAFRVVSMLEYAFDKETAKSWLLGKNSRLQDQSPAYAIRNGVGIDDYHPVIVAAMAFCLPKFI
jgi:hypothetical protein